MNPRFFSTGLVCLLSLLLISPLFAQRHIKGFKGIDIRIGKAISQNSNVGDTYVGDLYGVGYSAFLGNRFYLKGQVGVLTSGNHVYPHRYDSTLSFANTVSYTSYMGDISGNFTLFNLAEVFFFNVSVGASASYDQLNSFSTVASWPPATATTDSLKVEVGKSSVPDAPSDQARVGGFAGIESELYVSKNFTFLFAVKQRFLLKSAFNSERLHATMGLRFNF